MRVSSCLLRAALVAPLLAVPVAAQQGQQPNLVLSIGLGVHTGHGLWTIPSQPLAVIGTNPPVYDSLRLVRTISPGIVATFSGTYFPSTHVGVNGSVTFLDIGMENTCEPVAPYASDFYQRNQKMCVNLAGTVSGNSAILLGAGVTLRAASRGRVSPYVRGGLALGLISTGTIGVASLYDSVGVVRSRQILADEQGSHAAPTVQLAAGTTLQVGTGYQLRLEVRDDYFPLTRVTDSADGLGRAPTDRGWYHHWALTLGLDIVLERRRPRRY